MASTSEASQPLIDSSSPSLPPRKYEVFLSFRGEDTRRSFTDHLFAALCQVQVHTFRDAEEVHKGEDISKELINAINESMISIVIFSKTYAFSSWCLRELEEILKCKKRVNQVVLPVFYDVDPSEVRKQTGGFGDALTLHQQRFGDKQVNQWKDDLKEVADFSGWDLKNDADGYESKLIDRIVERVLQLVNRTYLNVAKHPVGIHIRVREILSLLQSKPNDGVRVIGIYGMGGVGKTTLANAVFNRIHRTFGGSCFLADVRSECSEGGRVGLKHLQKQLLCKTLNTTRFEVDHIDEGISLIKLRLGLKKLLIVVDDVDDKSQLDALVGERDWFGPGSIIIITTRNVDLLNGLGKDCEKYNVAMLTFKESLELFSWYAFKNPNPFEAFVELSSMIVRYVNGLPLALTILGSHFRARSSIQQWGDDFEKLRRIPHNDILKILKISYKALDIDTKRIFLDVACFFTGRDFTKEEIIMILKGCGFFAESGITTLVDRCLLTEDLCMHDLVRDMGRAIVIKDSLQPEKRSRLFSPDEVLDVLVNNKGTEAIQTMIIDLPKNVCLSTQVFSKMTGLRLLKILFMDVTGSLQHLPNELRLLYWRTCRLRCISSDFCLEKLVILDMSRSYIEEFQINLQHFRCLKTLNLSYCMRLKGVPNFTGAHSLHTLFLYGCWDLVELPQSIGDLKNLVRLDIGCCGNLRKLPSSTCELKSLELLNMAGCSKIEDFPANLGKLEQLRELNAFLTPESSSGCLNPRLVARPWSNARNISYYKSWDGRCDSLSDYYHYISGFTQRDICLTDYQNPREIHELPPSLEVFYAANCHLPEKKLGHLSKLQRLFFMKCQLPALLQVPPNLKALHVEDCLLPEKVLGHFSMLRFLHLEGCQNLRVLQELPPNLVRLRAKNCVLLEKVLGLSGLKHLQKLHLSNCNNLIELQGLENLVSIEDIVIRNCSALNVDPWIMNFKAHSHDFGVEMMVSKDMVPEDWSSNKVVRYSSNYTLEEKLRLIVSVSPNKLFYDLRCALKHKTTGVELLSCWLRTRFALSGVYDDLGGTRLAYTKYAHFKEPIKVEELEVCIEFHPLSPHDKIEDLGKKFSVYPCLVYEENDSEVCFFPINPNGEVKFPPGWIYGDTKAELAIPDSDIHTDAMFFDSELETEQNSSPESHIWEVIPSYQLILPPWASRV